MKELLVRMKLVFWLLFLFNMFSHGQEIAKVDSSKYDLNYFIEGLGNGFIYSINIEKTLYRDKFKKINGHIGAMLVPLVFIPSYCYSISAELCLIKGNGTHFWEVGIGITNFSVEMKNLYTDANQFADKNYFIGRIGYRYESQNNNLLFRAGLLPVLSFNARKFFPIIGISIGRSL